MITLLITGVSGFIGSHMARHCLAAKHQVVVLDDLNGRFEDHLPEGVTFIRESITDHNLLEDLFN